MPFHLSDVKCVIAIFIAVGIRPMPEERKEMEILIQPWGQHELIQTFLKGTHTKSSGQDFVLRVFCS